MVKAVGRDFGDAYGVVRLDEGVVYGHDVDIVVLNGTNCSSQSMLHASRPS
jgi:hypothetical protein